MSRRMLSRGWILAAVLSVPSLAFAQPAPPPPTPGPQEAAAPTDEEKKQFADARDAYEAKKFDVALPKFQMIANETHSPNARLYAARCLMELKRYAEAYDEMKATAADPSTDPKYEKTKQTASEELAPLEKQVGHLQIQLSAEQKGAAVTVNGKPVPEDKLGSVTVMPGSQQIELNQPGKTAQRQSVDVGAGETKSVTVTPVSEKPIEHHSQGLGTLRIVAIGVAGLGVISLAAGIGTGVASNGKFDEVQTACRGLKPCPSTVEPTIDSGKSLEKASTATFVIGGVLVAASIPLFIFGGPKKSASTEGSAWLTVQPTFGGASIGAAGQF